MQLGMIGLGRMGFNLVCRQLRDRTHECVVADADAVTGLVRESAPLLIFHDDEQLTVSADQPLNRPLARDLAVQPPPTQPAGRALAPCRANGAAS